jgi:hypothetical protein
MATVDVKLTIAARPDTEAAPPGAVHAQIWDVLKSYASRYAGSGDGERVMALLGDVPPGHAEPDALIYALPAEEPLAAHMIRLAAAGELELIDRLLDESGYALVSPRDSVKEALAASGDACPMCAMLRPEPGFEQAMIEHLAQGHPDVVSSAAWYMRQTGSPSREAVEAVIEAGGKASPEAFPALQRAIETMAVRHDGDLAALLRLRAASGRSGSRAVALAGACALARVRADVAAILVEPLLDALSEDNPVTEVAAEQVGYLLRDTHRDRALAGLLALLDRRVAENTRHNAVLSIVNLHLPPRPLTADVRRRLEREVQKGGPAAELAGWALRSFV